MSKGIIETVAGVLLITAGAVLETIPGGQALGTFLIVAGAGLLLTGIGTLLAKGPLAGFSATTRNPVAPWEVGYGVFPTGGTLVYVNHWGDTNKFLDMVIVVAAHPCSPFDGDGNGWQLRLDNQRVQMGASNHPPPPGAAVGTGTSFNPLNSGRTRVNINTISRSNPGLGGGVVTVTLDGDIPLAQDGDQITITEESGNTLQNFGATGKFQITIIDRIGGNLTFYYLSGGVGFTFNGGEAFTNFPTYWDTIYFEPLYGNQTLGETFQGMLQYTPMGGLGSGKDGQDQNNYNYAYNDSETNSINPWTADCSLVGMSAVFIRMLYAAKQYPGGLPQISVLISGKNDIADVRTSPPTIGYSTNAALCIADYLSNVPWGMKAAYGTEIDNAQLIAAANICDEQVPVSIPLTSPYTTETRYTCNGKFNLAVKRGEVLRNLLTSCAGRLLYLNGSFKIVPGAYAGTSLTFDDAWMRNNSNGPIRWRPLQTISDTYNGVKGTFIAPTNSWQSSDFPRYAQDEFHGYNNGAPQYFYDENLTIDGGDRRWLDIQLPFTISYTVAQRIAKIELLRRRQQGTGTFMFNMYGYQIVPLDILSLTFDYFGWTNKLLEVLSTRFRIERKEEENAAVTVLGVEVDVQETDPSVYDFELIELLSPQGYQVPGVPDTLLVPDPPSNLHVIFGENGDPYLAWTPPVDPYVTEIKGRYQLVASPEGIWVSLGTVDVSVTSIPLPALLRGANYTLALESINAAGVTSAWVSINYVPLALPPQWGPYFVRGTPDDFLWADEWTFDVTVSYLRFGSRLTLTHGAVDARVVVQGMEPVDQTIVGMPAPIVYNYMLHPTGGNLVGGTAIYWTVTADDGNGNYTLPAATSYIQIPPGPSSPPTSPPSSPPSSPPIGPPSPPTGTYSVSFDVQWPNIPGLTRYTIYAGSRVDLVTAQAWNQILTSGPASPPVSPPTSPPSVSYSPTALLLTGSQSASPPAVPPGALVRSWNPPDPNLRTLRIKGASLLHAGVLGATIDSVSGNVITSHQTIDLAGIDNWAGRALFITGRTAGGSLDPRIPLWSRLCTAFNPATGQFTFSGPPGASPAGANDPIPGDVFIVATMGYDNSGNPFELNDPGWASAGDFPTPHAGLGINNETGTVIWVVFGTSRGLGANVLANTATAHILDRALPIDASSIWIVVENGWPYQVDYPALANPNPFRDIRAAMPIANLPGLQVLVRGYLTDVLGQESGDGPGPYRIVWSRGQGLYINNQGSSPPLDNSVQMIVANTGNVGAVTLVLPDPSLMTGRRIQLKKDLTLYPATFVTPSGLIR